MLPSSSQAILLQHLDLVIEANKTTNLTRITSREEGKLLHIEDSLSALPEIQSAPEGYYADIGSGGGFPGIPLAVTTSRITTLVETRKKKAELLQSFIEYLNLQSTVSVFQGRAELLAQQRTQYYSVITARALAKLSVLEELASPLLIQGGLLICYKAHVDQDEYNNARRVQDQTGMLLVSDRAFTLSDNITHRRILCFEKTSAPKMKLPRKEGLAQKKPI